MNYSEALKIISSISVPSLIGDDCQQFRKTGNSCAGCFIQKECHSIPFVPNSRQILIEQLKILARKEKLEKLLKK